MQSYVEELLQIQQQLKVFHWQTKSYARHNAYGQTYEELSGLIDSFVEIHMGKYGRFQLVEPAIELTNLNDQAVNDFLTATTNFFASMSNTLDPKLDTDLLNIRDEMLGAINKLKYLLSLN